MSRDWLNLTWSEKTWSERMQTALAWVMAAIAGLIMFGVGILVLGDALDGISRYNSEHNRCLQKATNGLEIKQCR
jgi:uncharacterized membrane protein YidH (DUF202 family)